MNPSEQTNYGRAAHPRAPIAIRENFNGCNGLSSCLSEPQMAPVQETGNTYSPCMNCTSIYMALKDRSPFDRMYLRSYNKLPAHYPTNLDSLVFAP